MKTLPIYLSFSSEFLKVSSIELPDEALLADEVELEYTGKAKITYQLSNSKAGGTFPMLIHFIEPMYLAHWKRFYEHETKLKET